MKEHFVISAVGKNIVGIVSAVSKAVYECGCDFQNSTIDFDDTILFNPLRRSAQA